MHERQYHLPAHSPHAPMDPRHSFLCLIPVSSRFSFIWFSPTDEPIMFPSLSSGLTSPQQVIVAHFPDLVTIVLQGARVGCCMLSTYPLAEGACASRKATMLHRHSSVRRSMLQVGSAGATNPTGHAARCDHYYCGW